MSLCCCRRQDPGLPIYARWIKLPDIETITRVILDNHNEEHVAVDVPRNCQQTATFILDSTKLKNRLDHKADDLGTFLNRGRVETIVTVHRDDDGKVLEIDVGRTLKRQKGFANNIRLSPNEYLVRKTFYIHKHHRDFKRRVAELVDHNGGCSQFMLIQYVFSDKEHPVQVQPHGNSQGKQKSGHRRTAASVLGCISQSINSGKQGRKILHELYDEAGGIMTLKSCSQVPRNEAQIYNLASRQKASPKMKDELFHLIEKTKEENAAGDCFVRTCDLGEDILVMVCYDWQLDLVERFCTDPDQFSVFAVDTTYNCGEFYVTPTTYRDLRFSHERTQKPPSRLGPVLLHTSRKRDAFSHVVANIVKLKPTLRNILFIGRDRDPALSAFLDHMPLAVQLFCKGHVEDDIHRKLQVLGLGSKSKDILRDIFGSRVTKGLVDCASKDEFDHHLGGFKLKWDQAEKETTGTTSPRFFQWFCKNQVSDLKEGLLLPVRQDAGLDMEHFYNNCSECINRRLKAQSNVKKQNIPDFIEKSIKPLQKKKGLPKELSSAKALGICNSSILTCKLMTKFGVIWKRERGNTIYKCSKFSHSFLSEKILLSSWSMLMKVLSFQ